MSTLAETALMAAHHLRNLPVTRESDDIRIAKALEEAAADGDQGIVNYWRDTYHRRTEEARRLRGALEEVDMELFVLRHLGWWQWRARRQRYAAIGDILEAAGVEQGMATRGSRVG